MKRQRRIIEELRQRLLNELKKDVEGRFGGNKTKAAEAIDMSRIQFTNLCNGREGATIDKLIQIGVTLDWKIELHIERRKEKEP